MKNNYNEKNKIKLLNLGNNLRFLGIGVSLFMIVVLMMLFSTPQQLGPVGIVGWFIVLALGIFFIILGFFSNHTSSLYRRAGIVSVTIISILAMQSLHQLSLRDIVLITVLAGLVEFYLTKSEL